MPSQIWIYLVPFLSSLLSFLVGHFLARLNRSYAETKEQKAAREKAAADRETSIDSSLSALKTAIETERQTRLQENLKTQGDLGAQVSILSEFAEAQKLLTGMAQNVHNHENRLNRHDTALDNFNTALDKVRDHIHSLALKRKEND